jgi:hypothetical protein
MSGFIAVYRWRVAMEGEAAFRERWRQVTEIGREHGAFGSCLARAATGELVAIALWPDENTRNQAFEKMGSSPAWPRAERLDEMRLDVLDDLWAVSAFRHGSSGEAATDILNDQGRGRST